MLLSDMLPVLLTCINCSCTVPEACPLNSNTISTSSASIDDCICNPGYWGNNCTICPPNYYCPFNSSVPIACPNSTIHNIYSTAGSIHIDNCTCPLPFFRQNNKCVQCPATKYIENAACILCPVGSFCPGDGLIHICPDNAVCENGTAGIGFACNIDYFFEPRVVEFHNVSASAILVTADYFFWAARTSVYKNNTQLASSFVHVTSLCIWRKTLFIADQNILYALDLQTLKLTKVLQGFRVFSVIVMDNGLLLVSSDDMLIEINPTTNQNFIVAQAQQPMGLVHNSTFSYVCERDQVSVYQNGLLQPLFSATKPQYIAAPLQQIIWTSGNKIWQQAPDSTYDLLHLPGMQSIELQNISGIQWSDLTMQFYIIQPLNVISLSMCHACPPNSTTFTKELSISRCKCKDGMYMQNYTCTPCPTDYYCINGQTRQCPPNYDCPSGSSTLTLCKPGYLLKDNLCIECGSSCESSTGIIILSTVIGSIGVILVAMYFCSRRTAVVLTTGKKIKYPQLQIDHFKHF